MPVSRFKQLLGLIVVMIFTGVALGWLSPFHPAFDTLAHFRLWAGYALFLLGILWIWLFKERLKAILILAFAAITIATAWSGIRLDGPRSTFASDHQQYKLFHLNLLFTNPNPMKVLDAIRESNPDFLVLHEVSYKWKQFLPRLTPNYPHQFYCPEWRDFGGSIILSKYPFAKQPDFCGPYGSMALAQIDFDGQLMTLGAVHFRWPWPASGPRQLIALTPTLKQLDKNALIAGDFNATPWSQHVHKFAQSGGLTIENHIGPSWLLDWLPASLTRYVGLPIDQILHKGRVQITHIKTLDPVGSDHLPQLVEFGFN